MTTAATAGTAGVARASRSARARPAEHPQNAQRAPYARGAEDVEEADRTLTAVRAALAAEHAALYGYGVVGGRISEQRQTEARQAHDAHRAHRDTLWRSVRELGGRPEPAAAAYALPFEVRDGAAAVRLAAELEDRIAAVYADLVVASEGTRRRDAAAALREAAVRSARWRGGSVAFPGLAERTDEPDDAASPE